ncbi:copper fist DNA binding domain-containing protein [Lentinula guzmanii]|uniref:Copper fist DNA binding domain-containing protein n=1 Tax=Lentinula guzmanii TaxID=2804957 RepID=A0AA38N289_9AGAR|nr:copper fist DNA binding domain-containing protein [Lentinula guzmanii]
MVLIESKKYACETCIKGHRSSACKHTDRALYEIKKKGRPVTQCEHCRELRKTKQVHVKCICQKEEIVTGVERTSGCSKQAVNKMLESAAFPNGLPKALEASVAVQLLSQGATSDSDLDGCSCLSGDECHCWTPRKVAPRGGKKGKSIVELPASTSSPSPESSTPAKVENTSSVQNRLADLRTLLPKPAHDPSASAAVHPAGRSHPHELYSPYGRAHDQVHPNHSIRHTSKSPQTDKPSSAVPVTHPFNMQRSFYPVDRSAYSSGVPLAGDALQAIYPEFDPADIEAWKSFQMTGFASITGSLCGCGDECACPGCIVHKPNISRTVDASKCGQPDGCRDCMDCSASFSYQSSQGLPPNTALSIYKLYSRFPAISRF